MSDVPSDSGERPVVPESPPVRSFGQRMARFAIITGGVGLGVVGLVVLGTGGGVLWLTTAGGNEFLRGQILKQSVAAIPEGSLDIQSVETDLFGHVTLKGVSLANPAGKPMVAAQTVRLRYDLSHLLDKRVDITEVAVVRPVVDVEVLADGNLDLAAAFGPAAPAPEAPPEPAPWVDVPADIRVSNVHIDQASLRYRDASDVDAPLDVTVDGLALRLDAVVRERLAEVSGLHLELGAVGGLGLDLPLPLTMDSQLRYDESVLTVQQLDISARRSVVGIAGQIQRVDFDDRVLDLSLDRVDLDEADIEALAGDDVLLGSLRMTGAVRGDLSDLTTTLSAETPGGALALSATVNTTAQPLAWKVGLQTDSLDVDRVTPLVAEPTHLNLALSAEGEGTDPAGDLRGTFSMDAKDQVVFNESLPLLRLGGRIADGVVSLEEFGAIHQAAQVAATGRIDLRKELVELDSLDARVPRLSALRRYGVKGLQGSAVYAGRLRVEGFGEGGVLVADGGLDLRSFAAEDAVSVQRISGPLNARVELDTAAVQASGQTRLSGVDAPGASVESLELGWSATVDAGVVSVASSLGLQQLSVGDGAVHIDDISTPSDTLFRAGVDASGEPWAVGRLVMSEMAFGTAGYEAEGGEIVLGFRDPDGNSGPDTSRLSVGFDLDRNGDQSLFEGHVEGDLISGAWTIRDLVIAPTDASPLVADGPVTFQLADGGARDIRASLSSSAGSLRAEGDWVPDSEDGSSLMLEVDKVDLDHIARMAQLFVAPEREGDPAILEGLTGIASLSVKLDDQPGRDLQLDAVADLDGVSFPDTVEKIFLDAEVHGPITLPNLDVRMADADEALLAAITGTVPLKVVEGAPQLDCTRKVGLDALVAPGNIQRFSRTLPIAGDLPEVQASAAILVGGIACDPDLSLVSSASIPAGLRGERVRVDLDVHRKQGVLNIDGGVDIGVNRRVRIEGNATTNLTRVFEGAFGGGEMPPTDQLSTFASAVDLSISALGLPVQELSAFAALPRGIHGRISGGINLSGASSAPQVSGGLIWSDGAIGEVRLEQAGLMLLPSDGGYTIDGDMVFSTGGDIRLDGYVPVVLDLDSGDAVNLERDGFEVQLAGNRVPLQVLEGVVDGLSDAGGVLSLSGGLGGTVAEPVPAFSMSIADGTFALRDARLLYRDLDLKAELTRQKLSLDHFSVVAEPWGKQLGVTGVGPLTVEGEVALGRAYEPTDIDLKVAADKFWVADRKDFRLRMSIPRRIKVKGAYPDLFVGGGIVIDEGRLALDESVFLPVSDLALDPVLVVHRKEEQYVQGKPQLHPDDDLSKHLKVNLSIDMSRGFSLDVTMPMDSSMGSVGASLSTATVDLEVTSPELKVGMADGNPSIVGDVEMGRGKLDFFGKSFDIGGGKLTFLGENYADPVLDLQATHRTGRYGDVGVGISGTASKFDIDFKSDDYPDQTDIVSILLFGKPASELGDSEGQSGGSQLSAALQMAAGSQVSRALGSSLGGQIEFDQGAVKAGVPLSDKFFLSLERNANAEEDENVLSVALEWLITRQAYAEVVTGDAGQSSADLFIRWRF